MTGEDLSFQEDYFRNSEQNWREVFTQCKREQSLLEQRDGRVATDIEEIGLTEHINSLSVTSKDMNKLWF